VVHENTVCNAAPERLSSSSEIIAYAVCAYHRFALCTAGVEDLLAERGVIISRETIRLWVNHFGAHFAACIRRDRPRPNDKWHLDEVVIPINGVKHQLWRAADASGDVLDILVQDRRNAKAAKRFMARLITQFGAAPGRHHRQTAQLHKADLVSSTGRRSPCSQRAQQSHRRQSQVDATTRKDHGAVQVATSSAALPRCT